MNKPFRHWKWVAVGLVALVAIVVVSTHTRPTLVWDPYHPDKLAAAKSAGKLVILDFYADWCDPCHMLDKRTFSDRGVIGVLTNFVRLKVNLTDYDSLANHALEQQYNIEGLPTVILLGPDGQEVPHTRVLGFLPAEDFLEQMKLKKL